jgi:hypothetical protein
MNRNHEIAEAPVRHDGNGADVILRSTDNSDIRTSKALLSQTSDFFQTMFTMPQPSSESSDQEISKDGLAVIPVDTDASLLQKLLWFCNPASELNRLDEVQRLATKYQMYEVAKRILRERISGKVDLIPPIILAEIEKNTGRNNDAHLADMSIIGIPEDTDDVADLELVTKVQFDSLLDYRKECVAAAVKVAGPDHGHYTWMSDDWTESIWFKDDWGEHGRRNCNEGGWCYIGKTQGKWMKRYWWREYLYAAEEELKKRPYGLVVQGGEFFERALNDASKCSKCKEDVDNQFRRFAALFASEIDKAVSSVSEY